LFSVPLVLGVDISGAAGVGCGAGGVCLDEHENFINNAGRKWRSGETELAFTLWAYRFKEPNAF
jgi:hypothetical protein